MLYCGRANLPIQLKICNKCSFGLEKAFDMEGQYGKILTSVSLMFKKTLIFFCFILCLIFFVFNIFLVLQRLIIVSTIYDLISCSDFFFKAN